MDSLSMEDLKDNLQRTSESIGNSNYPTGKMPDDDAFYLSLWSQYERGRKLCIELFKRLQKEKARRVYWQGLCYHAMTEIDKAMGRRVSKGEGTTESTFKGDMTKLRKESERAWELLERWRASEPDPELRFDTRALLDGEK